MKIILYILINLILVTSLSATDFKRYSAGLDTTAMENSNLTQCAVLLKACLNINGTSNSNCIYATAQHPFCDGSELGKLAFRRWKLDPNRPVGLDPERVNLDCLRSFDKNLNEFLTDSNTSLNLNRLLSKLDHCKQITNIDLVRP